MDTKGLIKVIKDQTIKDLKSNLVQLSTLDYALKVYQSEERYEVCEGIKQAINEYVGTN